jgi:hypothetical protein
VAGVIAMTLIGSYVDGQGMVVSVSIEATRQGSYLVVKDRWRGPRSRDGATVELEVGSPGNARWFAECHVLMHGGRLCESPQGLVCAKVVEPDGQDALRESRRKTRTLKRFLHVPAPGFADG